MSKRGIDAPLAEQMDRLKRSMHSRDRRRDQDREKRLVSKAADDPYAQTSLSRPATGGISLGPGAAAQAAVLNAAAVAGPVIIRCDLCQADFRNQAMLRQHEEGPAHKKALARAQAERERNAWVTNPSAASNALQAAAWLNGGGVAKEPNYRPPARQATSKLAGAPQKAQHSVASKTDTNATAKPRGPSHAELIAEARRANEPISINGWIPPPLTFQSTRTTEGRGNEARIENSLDQVSNQGEPGLNSKTLPDELEDGNREQLDAINGEADHDSSVASDHDARSLPRRLLPYASSASEDSVSNSDSDRVEPGKGPRNESFF